MSSTVRQRLEVLEDITMRKMEKIKFKINEETNLRHTKEALLAVSLQQLMQEKEKATALGITLTDAVTQNIQQSAQIHKLESIKADLQAMILEEQRLRDEERQNVSELQLQLQKMAKKVHEAEGQLMDVESKWAITPIVNSYSRMPHARSFSADEILIQKCIKPYILSRISMGYGIKQKLHKQRNYSVMKHLRYFTSPKGQSKMIQPRRSTGQICSAAVEPIIVSPLVASTPEEKVDNFVEAANDSKSSKDSVMILDVPQTSAVKAALQKFEKLSPRTIRKDGVPKRRLFEASKRRSLKQEKETGSNKSHVQHNVGTTWKPNQSLAVPSSHPLPDVTDETMECERSIKRSLSPTVWVGQMKKPRAEELKSQQNAPLPC